MDRHLMKMMKMCLWMRMKKRMEVMVDMRHAEVVIVDEEVMVVVEEDMVMRMHMVQDVMAMRMVVEEDVDMDMDTGIIHVAVILILPIRSILEDMDVVFIID